MMPSMDIFHKGWRVNFKHAQGLLYMFKHFLSEQVAGVWGSNCTIQDIIEGLVTDFPVP